MENNNQHALYILIGKIISAVLVVILGIMILPRVDKYLRIKAVDDCSKVSRYEKTEEGNKYSYPLSDHYKNCMKDKGFSE